MRDFLTEAKGPLGLSRPLGEMLAENKEGVLSTLVEFLEDPNTMKRKYAAFALGQIGEQGTLDALRAAYDREAVKGVRDALEAAITAIREVPPEADELARARAVENVYDGKAWDAKEGDEPQVIRGMTTDTPAPQSSPAPAKENSGCFTMLACLVLALAFLRYAL